MIKQLSFRITFFLSILVGSLSYGQMINSVDAFSIQDCTNGQAIFTQASNYTASEYSWYWDSSLGSVQTGGSIVSPICPGNYTFHLDSLGIEIYSENFTIGSTDPCLGFHVSSFGWSGTAPNGCTGYINADLAGGTAPFTYSWNNGCTVANNLNLCAGYYILTAHDANGCSDNMDVTIGVDSTLSAAFQAHANASPTQADTCGGISSVFASGGVMPYTYNWGFGNTSDMYNYGLCPGTYSVTAYDASGDSIVMSYTITIACQGFEIVSMNATTTYDNGCTGSITPDVIGGAQPYYYVWSGDMQGAGFSNASSLTDMCYGSYTLEVYDSLGCGVIDSAQILVGIPTILADLNIAMDWLGNCTGTAEVSPSGGVAPYTILWSNAETTGAVDNLCAGMYSVSITDSYGTAATFPFAITDSSSTYGNDPYGDSTVVGNLYDYLVENCTIDYSNIDSAALSAAVYDSVSQNLYVTWEIYTPNGITYINDTLGCSGENGVYNLTITVFCPQKSSGNYMSIHGQIYLKDNVSFLATKEHDVLTVQAFPNPFNDEFTIRVNEIGNYTVSLNDALGRTIQSGKYEQTNQLVIHPDHALANGNYFLVIESAAGRSVLKLVH